MILTILNFDNGKVYKIHNLPEHILNCSESLEHYILLKNYH